MPAAHRRKTRYSNPAKGTKTRAAVNLMLRREGATTYEIADVTNMSLSAAGSVVQQLIDQRGFDIAVFPEPLTGRRGRRACRYKIIGRYRWDGSYRSFVSTDA
jgi:hypothetical protein